MQIKKNFLAMFRPSRLYHGFQMIVNRSYTDTAFRRVCMCLVVIISIVILLCPLLGACSTVLCITYIMHKRIYKERS
jgi:hypothetical protein